MERAETRLRERRKTVGGKLERRGFGEKSAEKVSRGRKLSSAERTKRTRRLDRICTRRPQGLPVWGLLRECRQKKCRLLRQSSPSLTGGCGEKSNYSDSPSTYAAGGEIFEIEVNLSTPPHLDLESPPSHKIGTVRREKLGGKSELTI